MIKKGLKRLYKKLPYRLRKFRYDIIKYLRDSRKLKFDLQKFNDDMRKYTELNNRTEFVVCKDNLNFCVEWNTPAANLSKVLFLQDVWAAKKVYNSGVKEHFDIGSSVYGFISGILPFTNVTLIDIRPLDFKVDGLNFIQADATNLENIEDNSISSLSALCSLEHFGLGRYGDPIDPDADRKAFKAIQRVLRGGGGRCYISVPVGRKNILRFNDVRVYTPDTIINEFNKMTLIDFSMALSDGTFIENAMDDNSWVDGYGFFEFIKK